MQERVVEVEVPSERQVDPWEKSRPPRKRCTSSMYSQLHNFILNELYHFLSVYEFNPLFCTSSVSAFSLCCHILFVSTQRRKEQEQLAALKQHHQDEIDHKKEIERLQREIDRHKGKIRKLKHDD